MIYNRILCIGDSLTYGSRDQYERGYPAELAQLLNSKWEGQFFSIANQSWPGIRSGELLKRVHTCLNIFKGEVFAVCLMIGTNDTQLKIPVDVFADNVYQLIKNCQIAASAVVVGGLPTVSKIGLFSYDCETQDLLNEYNIKLEHMCNTLEVPFVNMDSLHGMQIDKVHFGNDGYKKMAKLWMEAIESL